jgi:polypeptide N-acetylgalactosaminyltransferase
VTIISGFLLSGPHFICFSSNSDEFGMVQNSAEQFIRDDGYKKHAFNVLVSNKLGLVRDIPDTRNKLCGQQSYGQELPTASVIMCFYNEHLNTLLRSVQSILQRTPEQFLAEIILVDDRSDSEELNGKLVIGIEKFNAQHHSKVKLIRNERREGLIRSRVYGARQAKADILVFLDSHIEVNTGWIEPLLYRIKENSKVLAMPVIDIINADTFAYSSSPLVKGGFNWGLHFLWDNLKKGMLVILRIYVTLLAHFQPIPGTLNEPTDFLGPFLSPTMAGGLFAVNRSYFSELGEYDMGMDIWGGENLEISFRAWLCGVRTVRMKKCKYIVCNLFFSAGLDRIDSVFQSGSCFP